FFRKKDNLEKYRRKRKVFAFRLFILFALLAYLLFAPSSIEKVPVFSRIWSEDITESGVEDSVEGYSSWLPFLGESELGYLSPEGKLLYREELLFHAAVDEGTHVNYTRTGETPGVYRAKEDSLVDIEPEGFPVFRDRSLYLVSPDRMSIISIDENGKEKFRFDFSSLITGFDVRSDLMVIGLLNGKAELFSREGERRAVLTPRKNSRPVYGAAVSPGGDKVSLLWGDGPQYVSIFDVDAQELSEGEAPAERGRVTRDKAVLSEALMRFSGDGTLLYYETPSGCAVLDIAELEEREIPFSGSLFDITSKGRGAPLYVLGNREEEGFIRVYSQTGTPITSETLQGRLSYFYPYGSGGVYTAGGTAVFFEGGSL
ncbi:MAG: hypothetical protein ACLFSA_03750, partial [Spirochaetaceae bacterium]